MMCIGERLEVGSSSCRSIWKPRKVGELRWRELSMHTQK